MENIQTNNEITISQSKINIFKVLFFISLLIIIGQIICICSILNKYKTNRILVQNKPETQSITPTQNQSVNMAAYVKSDDKKINLILNQNGKETIIDSLDKDGQSELYNNGFNNIRFSSSLTYLIYNINFVEGSIEFYNTKTHSFIKNGDYNGFMLQSETDTFITDDEKYIIYCSGGSYGGIDGGKIISTSDSSVKFDFVKYLGDKITSPEIGCRKDKEKIVFFYNGDQQLKYDLTTSEVE